MDPQQTSPFTMLELLIYFYPLMLQIMDIDGDDVQVKFMRQNGAVYIFPVNPDISC
jgi:hypothetical protein